MRLLPASLAFCLGVGPALAQNDPPTIPAGPYGDNDSLSSLRSYDQLLHAMQQYVATSQGAACLTSSSATARRPR